MVSRSGKRRLLFPPPSVLDGSERESTVGDFESISKRAIGEGAFGEVYKVRHKVTKTLYAIKVISKQKVLSSNLLPQLRREIRIMYSVTHFHVIKLYNHFEDDANFYLVLELAQGGTLWQRLAKFKSFDESTAAQYVREVILAVEYLHSRDPPIIHRDIKPENLLLDIEGREGRVKLADFGWSNFFNSDRTRMTYCGTLDYLAPEMINQEGHTTNLDLWNIGVLLFELLTGAAPLQADNQAAMFERILKVRISYPRNFPPLAKDLINRLLKANPAERITLAQVVEHPWLKTHGPIRSTLTQNVVREPLPCTLDVQDDNEVAAEDPIKPFHANEYRILSKPVQPEEIKQELLLPAPHTAQVAPALESSLKQIREENKQHRSALEAKEAELERVRERVRELEQSIKKAENDCAEKKVLERELRNQLTEKNNQITEMKQFQEDENNMYKEYEALRAKILEKDTQLSLLKNESESLEKLTTEKNSEAGALEHNTLRVKEEIESTKLKYSKNKSELQQQCFLLSAEAEDLLHRENHSERVTVEALLSFAQENLDMLKKHSKAESELVRAYQDANEELVSLDNTYTEIQLMFENELADVKRKTQKEIRFMEDEQLKVRPGADLAPLKQRLKEFTEEPTQNQSVSEEIQHLQRLVRYFELSK